MQAAKDFIGGLTGASPTAVARLRDEAKGELVDLLTRQDGMPQQALQAVTNALGAYQVNPNAGQGVYNALSLGGFGVIPSAAGGMVNLLGAR